ncbi:Glucose-repressible alcohol dehydrogenase transcriptional effector [Lambiella insularis]|nr:Glucose-repressible alcohol dehydrogenase transcriptional effector [Lambiella insularis]
MADGSYRFHQPGIGQYYQQQQHHHQVYNPRHLTRNGSPVNGAGARATYNNDTPSPSRSPISQGASQHHYSMFNQAQQQGQHNMMNGGNGHQRYMQTALPYKYQHQSNPQHHNQQSHHPQQNHGVHAGNGSGMGHQHSFSSGLLSSTPSNYNSSGLQSGSVNDDHGDLGDALCENWQEQLQWYAEYRQSASIAHRHTKKPGAVVASRGFTQPLAAESQRDGDLIEPNRPITLAEDQRQDWNGLDLSGQGLRALSNSLLDNYSFLTKLFIDSNKLVSLPPSISQLRNLEHLQASNNQLRELPDSIGMLVRLKQLIVFDNNLRTLPCEIGYLHRLEMLGIEGNPLEDDIKGILVQQGTQALIVRIRDTTECGNPPRPREMVAVDDSDASERFTVLDYNILCDKAATRSYYGYTPSKALSWEYRRDLILSEIKARDADIVCLQEVDMENYNEFFRRELAVQHYKGVYSPRSRARTMADKEARSVDGCATFYNGQKFIMLDKQVIEFSNAAINRPDMKGEHDIFNRVMPRDHIAVVTFLENRTTGSRVIVVNTHIFWDNAFKDVKLVQVAILMEQLTKLADRWATFPPCLDKVAFRYTEQDSETDPDIPEVPPPEPGPSLHYAEGSSIPLIICGDFNCAKESGIYELLDRGAVPYDHEDFEGRSYGSFTRDGISHPFNIKSSYDGDSLDGEKLLEFTNYTADFSGCLDYIWHSANTLRVKQLLGNVDTEYLLKVPGFPHFHFPSDHLPLFAEFSIEAKKERPKAVEADFGPQRERRN